MQYGGDDGAEEGAQSRTAFREAEKKYQLYRERKMKIKRGKKKPGKLVARPIDMSDVVDLRIGPQDSLPLDVVCHDVPGYGVPVYTFTKHPGLVYMPGALPPPQQLELTTAALIDYPEPPARTNHVLQYGPMTGLWRAAQQGLNLNWGRRDDPHPGPGPEGQTALADQGRLAGQKGCFGSAKASALPTDCEERTLAPKDNNGLSCCGSSSDDSGLRSHRTSYSGSDCCDNAVGGAPTFEECWSVDGPGPSAEKLLRKLRWATLGPQFNWTERLYEFEAVHRRLPSSLEILAKQMAAVVDRLQIAGLKVMPPAAASRGYKPDAAIVNYYQQGDVLGGHLDDVERDMAQPIVSVSLGCPAIFLMGGTTKQVPPSAILVRGGDVVLLAGEARCCYHGVPRILEPHQVRAPNTKDAPTCLDNYIRCARINISIRAAS